MPEATAEAKPRTYNSAWVHLCRSGAAFNGDKGLHQTRDNAPQKAARVSWLERLDEVWVSVRVLPKTLRPLRAIGSWG